MELHDSLPAGNVREQTQRSILASVLASASQERFKAEAARDRMGSGTAGPPRWRAEKFGKHGREFTRHVADDGYVIEPHFAKDMTRLAKPSTPSVRARVERGAKWSSIDPAGYEAAVARLPERRTPEGYTVIAPDGTRRSGGRSIADAKRQVEALRATRDRMGSGVSEPPPPLWGGRRHVRFHMKDGSVLHARVALLDLNRTRAQIEDERGFPTTPDSAQDLIDMGDVAWVEELSPVPGPDGRLVRREGITNGPARQHLDLLFLDAYGADRPWVGKLTNEEQEALAVYRNQQGFAALNRSLRTGDPDTDTHTHSQAEHTVAEWAALIDSAIEKAPAIDERLDLFMYRGVRDGLAVFGPEGPRPGQVITDRAYVSTTVDRETAQNFAERRGIEWLDQFPLNQPVVMEIVIPPGVRGAWMSGAFGAGDGEFVLPRGSTFEVMGVREDLGMEVGSRITVAEMRMLTPAEAREREGMAAIPFLDARRRRRAEERERMLAARREPARGRRHGDSAERRTRPLACNGSRG